MVLIIYVMRTSGRCVSVVFGRIRARSAIDDNGGTNVITFFSAVFVPTVRSGISFIKLKI